MAPGISCHSAWTYVLKHEMYRSTIHDMKFRMRPAVTTRTLRPGKPSRRLVLSQGKNIFSTLSTRRPCTRCGKYVLSYTQSEFFIVFVPFLMSASYSPSFGNF
ncbi:uncharacterized protein PHACADRAFT_257605 [Phanerochaete carnosa HHB-10118-sp]|uniref:Uncharacterized protein n=1 Tax=Phanerochaete carnosa (strain HHB-10118-sp) TaxID=650164 RepID=K5VRB8_PHACS|nr:uncharacterized protein PHACADRAFT_257605 [Phanerochaete carnosa HHB-10118-sp]EKM54023.1 hypothetical protein PHACADRAFT_257605 [Phanerochaete carnosa HHB-10118-sp]